MHSGRPKSSQDPEIILVDLTFPPSQQTVWRVTRYLYFPPGKEPLPEPLLTALRQKYGQDVPSPNRAFAYWVFDDQGRPATGCSGINLSDCAMYVERPNPSGILGQMAGNSTSPNVPPGVALNPTVVVANRDACHSFVDVTAYLALDGSGRDLVNFVTVTITDIGAGIRAGNATQALMNHATAAQEQRELNKARQRAAPTF
jgi:hypothetical protein